VYGPAVLYMVAAMRRGEAGYTYKEAGRHIEGYTTLPTYPRRHIGGIHPPYPPREAY